MFARLFANAGLSLDRLRALVEVGAAGSISRAAENDPVRQSQYSRQIKELEDFFQTRLVERHGKGVRLTTSGRELARISRFFLLGLSNFRRGTLAEEQSFRIGASATFIRRFLLPVLAVPVNPPDATFAVETADTGEIERRLHDLTLDFGIVTTLELSRPLQMESLGRWRLRLWVPKALCPDPSRAPTALESRCLPFVLPARELDGSNLPLLRDCQPRLICTSFLDAQAALEGEALAAFLPEFLAPQRASDRFFCSDPKASEGLTVEYRLAWNPRLLRLNPHAVRWRDKLRASLAAEAGKPGAAGLFK
jgi:DNA-binding transcriptional LysR family regulator